jgi:hypothetical protein
MPEKVIKRRYVGRVEVKAAHAEIMAMLAAGQPYAWIFDKLAGEGRLTISYRQFCQCLVQYCGVKVRPKRKKASEKPPIQPVQKSQETPRKGPYDSGDHNLPTFTRNLDEEISFL